MSRLVFFAVSLCNILFVVLTNNITTLFEWSFYFYILFLAYDILKVKDIYLIHVWIGSFLFIIISEGLLSGQELEAFGQFGIDASKFLLLANNLVMAGYYLFIDRKVYKYTVISLPKKYTALIILISIIGYFLYNVSTAITAFQYGRASLWDAPDRNILIDTFMNALALILPSIIVYYFNIVKGRRSFLRPFLLSMPIFAILFMMGSRYPLLFSFLGFVLVFKNSSKDIANKDLLVLAVLPLLLFLGANMMKQFRNYGELGTDPFDQELSQVSDPENRSLASTLSSIGSPESIIEQNAKMFDYFETHDHLRGMSTSFILYFWVPRSIWPNKPTLLGYWLIRDYGETGFGESHSVGFGFSGDFFADFGFFGGLLACFFLGFGLKRLETYSLHFRKSSQYTSVFVAMLYPYVFFAMRDLITSSLTLLLIISIFFTYGLLFTKQKKKVQNYLSESEMPVSG